MADKMNCVIPCLNIKVLGKALQSLAKIGDELFIEAKSDQLTLLTFNQSKTICGQFHMLDSFFTLYNVKDEPSVSCKIHMKTILPMFKGTNIDKKLEHISIIYEMSSDTLKFKVKYKTDEIVMSHNLCLLDPEVITIDNYSQYRSNSICGSSVFFNELLNLFSSSDSDITFEITTAKLVARNYYPEKILGGPQKPKSVRTQINLNSSEFSLYRIKEETTVNFPLKPFRTAISFAETFNLDIGFDFDKGGCPLSIGMKNPTFEVTFIVATINPDSDAQSTVAPASLPAKITQINLNGTKHNLTIEDINAIANENWEEFENEIEKMDKNKNTSKNESINKLLFNDPNKKLSISNYAVQPLEGDDGNQDIIPDSPRAKKARLIFKRSYDDTFHASVITNVLLRDSDSE